MPMYYDWTNVKHHSWNHPFKKQLFADFVHTVIRNKDYFERPWGVSDDDINTFKFEQATHDQIILWAIVRRENMGTITHVFKKHRRPDGTSVNHNHAEEDREWQDVKHSHFVLPLIVFFDRLEKDKWSCSYEEFARAERDMKNMEGLRVVASNSKMEPEEVFNR